MCELFALRPRACLQGQFVYANVLHPAHSARTPRLTGQITHVSGLYRVDTVPIHSEKRSCYPQDKMARIASLNVWRETRCVTLRKYFLRTYLLNCYY